MSGYVLSKQTAMNLKRLMATSHKGGVNYADREFTTRITGFVICGTEIESGKYNGTIQVYDVDTDTWETGEECILVPPPPGYDTKLLNGRGYIAVRYGVQDDKSLWAVAYALNCIEVVTDITCYDGTMTVTKECIYYVGEVRELGGYGTCCDDMGGY